MPVHIVWSLKFRYPVLPGNVQKKCWSLLIRLCNVEGVNSLKGVVCKDHVYMPITQFSARNKQSCEKARRKKFATITAGIFKIKETLLGSAY